MGVRVDPVTVIVSALAAGALHGVTDTATDAVKDAYTGLRDAVAAHFAGRPTAELVLAEHEQDPATYEQPLARQLQETGAADDPRVVELAKRLADLLGDRGRPSTVIDMRGAQGPIVGDGNTISQVFGAPLREP